MRFKVDGKEMSAERLLVGEVCEAEKFLQMDMDSGSGAKLAVCLYVAKKRAEPAMFPAAVADWVKNVDMTGMESLEDDAAPLPANGSGDPEPLRTSGPPPSVPTA